MIIINNNEHDRKLLLNLIRNKMTLVKMINQIIIIKLNLIRNNWQ